MEKKLSSVLLFSLLFAPIALTSCFQSPKDQGPKKVAPQMAYDEEFEEEEEEEEGAMPIMKAPGTYKRGSFGKTRAITSDPELNAALEYDNVIIDFWAPWCGPCKQLSPVLDQIAQKYPKVLIVKVDIDKSPTISNRFGVRSLPTLLYLKNGQRVHSETGYAGRSVVESTIQRVFAN